jgi:hypothetical protein
VPLGSKYANWLPGQMSTFMDTVFSAITANQDMSAVLLSTLAPISPDNLADAVSRGIAELGEEGVPQRFPPGFASELRGLYSSRLPASLARVVPRYLVARNQAIRREKATQQKNLPLLPEPAPGEIAVSHPLDPYVVSGLVAGTVDFNYLKYREANPSERAEHTLNTDITFAFAIGRGLWTWVQVCSPPDATPEDVANKLYGTPEMAYRIIPAPPMFGFYPGSLIEPYRSQWMSEARGAEIGPNDHQKRYIQRLLSDGEMPEQAIDPAEEASAAADHDDIALSQASKFKPTGTNRQDILLQMELIKRNLSTAEADASPFGGPAALVYPRDAVDKRLRKLREGEDPDEALKWGPHAAAQLDIVLRSASGIAIAKARLADAAKATGRPEKVPAYIFGPLSRMAQAYIAAAAASELVATGYERLAVADQLGKTLQIEILEGALDSASELLGEAKTISHGRTDMAGGFEEEYRAELIKALELIESDPAKAAEIVEHMREHVKDLHERAVVTNTRVQLDALGGSLDEAIQKCVDQDWSTDAAQLGGLKRELAGHRDICWALEQAYMPPNKEAQGQGWNVVKSKKADLATLLGRIQSKLESVHEKLKWADFAFRVFILAIIALATAGFGVYLGGVAAGLELGGVGTFLFVTGGEALFFTTATTLALEKDPSVGKFIEQFAINWATFGAMRGVSAIYRGVLGAAAKTLPGTLGEAMLALGAQSLVGLELADRQKRSATGQGLTESEARQIVAEGVLVGIIMMIGGRVAKDLMPEIQAQGGKLGQRLAAINKARASLRAQCDLITSKAPAVDVSVPDKPSPPEKIDSSAKQQPPPSSEQAQKLIEENNTLLEQEKEVLKDLEAETAKDPSSPQAAQVKEAVKANNEAIEKNDALRAASVLEPAGANEMLCEQGRLDEVEALHRKNDKETVTTGTDDDGRRTLTITPKDPADGPPLHITEKMTPGADAAITKAPEPVSVTAELPAEPKHKSIDDLLNADKDGFKDEKLDDAYKRYKGKKAKEKKPAKNREEWARSQTSSDYRKPLADDLGPDFFKQEKAKINIRDIPRPRDYTPDQYLADLATVQPHVGKVLQAVGIDPAVGIPGGEISVGAKSGAKGVVGEILARGKMADVLTAVRKLYPNAVIMKGLRMRLMSGGKLGLPKQFTDAVIGYFQGKDLILLGRFEVKSGPAGGQEATVQFFDWVEGRLTKGSVLLVPGKEPVAYGPLKAQRDAGMGSVSGLANSQTYIVVPKGAEHLGKGAEMQTVTDHERIPMDVTAGQIEFVTRLLLKPYITSKPAAVKAAAGTP